MKNDHLFACSFEGLYYYAFHLSEFLWGIVWCYDFILLTRRPSLFTGKYLIYYSCVVYFISFGFSIVVYFQDPENFTSVSALFNNILALKLVLSCLRYKQHRILPFVQHSYCDLLSDVHLYIPSVWSPHHVTQAYCRQECLISLTRFLFRSVESIA